MLSIANTMPNLKWARSALFCRFIKFFRNKNGQVCSKNEQKTVGFHSYVLAELQIFFCKQVGF